jgi:uracil-DNA glycosylase family 4
MLRPAGAAAGQAVAPSPDCPLCPRLRALRESCRADHPDWNCAPVPSFGEASPGLLVVGLAPGFRGANRTGRPFTGDFAGELLYRTLLQCRLAEGPYHASPDDGLRLIGCRITNAVRCAPPDNKPAPLEIENCRRFLAAEIASLRHLKAILALGVIAHDSVVACFGLRKALFPFRHGAWHRLPGSTILADSYHCSRQNTNTGRLTAAMFADVVERLRPFAHG